MNLNSLAITIVGGVVAVADLVCITILLSAGIAVPAEMWGLLATGGGAATIGAAVATGAAIASKDTTHAP